MKPRKIMFSDTYSSNKIMLTVTLLTLMTFGVSGVVNDRDSAVSQRIYQRIPDSFACFRRMNATHQVGCNSKQGGSVGVLQLVKTQADINWIVEQGPHSPYVALLHLEWFTSRVLEQFQNSEDRVSGVILLGRNESGDVTVSAYSPDRTCPNRGYGFYTNTSYFNFCPTWNEPGNEILFRDWSFPIFYASSETSVKRLLECYKMHNQPNDSGPRDWPLCSAELDSFMSAAVDTPTCIRRNKLNEVSVSPSIVCDPLGDANVWSTLVPSNQAKPHKKGSVIVIAARLDAASMFDQISPGADTVATGVTAILALVKQLAHLKQDLLNSPTVSNIYFMIFNGEVFDYIGSSRVVYDMANDNFPHKIKIDKLSSFPALLHLDDIMYYIELHQLSLSLPHEPYYVYRNWNSSAFNQSFNDLIERFKRQRLTTPILVPDWPDRDKMGVPPSSLQTFLGQNADFPGVVITNYQEKFKNKHYNSILDDAENIQYENAMSQTVSGISSLVATISSAIEELIKKGEKRPFSNTVRDPGLVNDILECYVKSPSCQLFQTVTNDDAAALDKVSKAFYVGVNRRINVMTTITQYVMGYHQGVITNRTKDDCQRNENDSQVFEYMWINGSCYETTSQLQSAQSPAFDDVDNYDWKSGKFSTWTESVWSDLRVRIFLQPSKIQEITTLISGIIVFAASIILFSWINTNADTIFKSRIVNGVC